MLSLKSRILILLAALLLTGLTNVEANDVVFIEKNQPAPFSGILFSEQEAKQIRRDLLEADKTILQLQSSNSKSETLLQIIELKTEEIELYRAQNNRLIKSEQTSETMRYVWFGLGVLATGMAVYGAGALAR